MQNRQSATEQLARRAELLGVASSQMDHSLCEENISRGELGSTRQATKYTRCGELGTAC